MEHDKTKNEEIVIFQKNILTPIPDYKLDMELISRINSVCEEIMKDKDKDYGGSWQADGLLSAHLNTKRKWDRIQNLFMSGFDNTQVNDETILDTLLDLRNYVTLYISFLIRKDPNMSEVFKELEHKE
jgi:hypothetical protein